MRIYNCEFTTTIPLWKLSNSIVVCGKRAATDNSIKGRAYSLIYLENFKLSSMGLFQERSIQHFAILGSIAHFLFIRSSCLEPEGRLASHPAVSPQHPETP